MAIPNKLEYYCDERSISNGTTDLIVRKTGLTNIKSIIVTNLSTQNDMTVKFNATTNSSRTVEAGKSLELENEGIIDNVYLSNASGASIDFSVFMIGG